MSGAKAMQIKLCTVATFTSFCLVVSGFLMAAAPSAHAGGSTTGAVYVALGDSYAAGEGLGGFESGTDVKSGSKQNTCHRSSSDAYASLGRSPTLVLPSVTDRAFWACSGATVTGVFGSGRQYGEPVQLATVGPTTKYVSLSVGGNDAYFADIVKACLKIWSDGVSRRLPGVSRTCSQQVTYSKTQLSALKSNLAGRVTGLYKRILDRASPSGVLVVAGYPRVFSDSPGGFAELNGKKFCATNTLAALGVVGIDNAFIGIEAEDITKQLNPFINGKDGLNDTIKQAVATLAAQDTYKGRIYYADTYNSSSTVPMNCEATPNTGQTLNGVMLSPGKNGTIAAGWISSATFHPTKTGQTLIGQAVQAAFQDANALKGVIQVSAGESHSCAVLTNGTVKCWGEDDAGDGGGGFHEAQSTPLNVIGITAATQVSAGKRHTCTLIRGGSIKCWGDNTFGQLGDGLPHPQPNGLWYSRTPVSVSGITNAVQIAAAHHRSCALLDDGKVKCWGSDSNQFTPVDVSGITTAIQISLGERHSCALLSSGLVKCWGFFVYGSDAQYINTPVSVSGITGAIQITAGSDYSCALLSGGRIKCWGENSSGQLGDGTYEMRRGPVSVSGITTATQVSSGAAHSCAVLYGGAVRCWGNRGYFGNLGDGSVETYASTPVVVLGITDAVGVSSGRQHSCALLMGATVKCWGRASYLGDEGGWLSPSHFWRTAVSVTGS